MSESNLDPFALARAEGDDAILALFREWRDGMERLAASNLDDDEHEPLFVALTETQRQIFDAKAAGVIGLAIKAFMLGYEIQASEGEYKRKEHPCAINPFAPDQYGAEQTLYLLNHALKGLIADAARLVPELAPLTAGIIASPLVLPPEREGTEDTPSNPFALGGRQNLGDAELIHAEREMRRLLDEGRDIDEADAPLALRWERIGKCMEVMNSTKPTTLAGCAAKLRFLTDEEIGMGVGGREDDVPSLRQVLAFLERGSDGMSAPDPFALARAEGDDDNAPATLRDLAQIAFDPWPADMVQEFDKVPWQERCETFGINLRFAISFMTKTKAELVRVARGMVQDGNSDALDAAMEVAICIKATGDELSALAEMASGAYSRYMVALAIVGTE